MINSRKSRGMSVAELLTVIAIIGVMVSVSVPAFSNLRRRNAVRAAVGEIRGVIHLTRARAVSRGSNAAVRFRQDGDEWVYLIYDDGDGDGVRNVDIERGIDPLASGPHRVLDKQTTVRIALPEFPLRDPDTNRVLPADASPVRFNRSKLCSFSPRGSGTSGSVFLTDGREMVAVVRIFGPTARVRMMLFDSQTNRWKK